MKLQTLCRIGQTFGAFVVAIAASAAIAGPLSPPAGPPSSTMKRLDEIEPRRLLSSVSSSSSAVFSITEPGQYYLSADVDCPQGKSAIEVVCPGEVSIDLNGFSLRGQPGSVDGIRCPGPSSSAAGTPGAPGVSLAISGRRKGWDGLIYGTHRSAPSSSSISGFSRAVSVGDVSRDGYADVVVSSLSISDCAQGVVHLHGQKIVHRDIACRGITGGDAFSVSFDGAPPSSNPLYQASGCEGENVLSRGMFVSSSSSGIRLTIQGSNFRSCGSHGAEMRCASGSSLHITDGSSRDCGGSGVVVGIAAGTAITGGDGNDILLGDYIVSNVGQHGVFVDSPPATSSSLSLNFTKIQFSSCVQSGVEVSNAGSVVVEDAALSKCANGVHIKSATLTVRRSSVSQCTATGVFADGCDAVEASSLQFSDCDGDAMKVSGSGGGSGKVNVQDLSFTRSNYRIPVVFHRALVVSDCDSVRAVRVAVGDVTGDGCDFSSCGKVSMQDMHFTTRRSSGGGGAGGLARAVVCTDCDDVECSALHVSRCTSDALSFSWGASNQGSGAVTTGGRSMRISDCVVDSCGGAGVAAREASAPSISEIVVTKSSFSRCAGGGLVVSCPNPASSLRLSCDTSHFRSSSSGSGVSVVAHPACSVSVSLSKCDLSSNAVHGASVESSVSGQVFVGSSVLDASSSTFSRNGGSGCVCKGGFIGEQCDFSDNGATGITLVARDAFTLGGTLHACSFSRNAGVSALCGPGRFSGTGLQISDGGADGIVLSSGCLLLTDSQVHRCAGDGVSVVGTFTSQGSAMRRNGGSGVRCASGVCSMSSCEVSLNGLPPGTPVLRAPGGITLVDCSTVSLQRCVVTDNLADGVSHSRVSMPLGTSCALSVSDCTVQRNSGNGLALDACSGGAVVRCSVSNNAGQGIWTKSGFTGGQISDCVCTSNMGSIRVDGVSNLIRSNSITTCAGVSVFTIAPGNAVGTVIDSAGVSTRCSPHDNVLH